MTKHIQDVRPNENINLEVEKNVRYFNDLKLKDYESEGRVKVNKYEIKKYIKEEYLLDVEVRYSSNYSDKVGEWRSWHSIDFVLESDKKINITKDYAFVTPNGEKLEVVVFDKEQFKKFIEIKNERNSYTDYFNAQGKECRKYNFYFTSSKGEGALFEEKNIGILVTPNRNVSILKRIWYKIREVFRKSSQK